jgi:hypothetical protein
MDPPMIPRKEPTPALRYLAWPYIGALVAAFAVNRIGDKPERALLWVIGAILVFPFIPVQVAIVRGKIERATGFIIGLLGPAAFFVVAATLMGLITKK